MRPQYLLPSFTGYERDAETGLDFARARYYASGQGRFTSADPLIASARSAAPQTWNRYAYALNNPLRLVDPSGLAPVETGHDGEPVPTDRQPQRPPPSPPVDLRKDATINKELEQIREDAAPLPPGTAPKLSDVKAIVGETCVIENGGYIDGYGNEATGFTGVVRPVAYVPLDQGGNIIQQGNGTAVGEVITVKDGTQPSQTKLPIPSPPGGVFIDVHALAAGEPRSELRQRVFVVQYDGSTARIQSAYSVGANDVVKDAKAKTISVKLGTTQIAPSHGSMKKESTGCVNHAVISRPLHAHGVLRAPSRPADAKARRGGAD